jgi:hypothetical protein
MAGDWIKIEIVTPDKPEIIAMSETLQIDQDAILGKLVRLWIWADQQTYDGNAKGNALSVTKSFIDRCTGVIGFAEAMLSTGWLRQENCSLLFPNFDRHNGQTAKQRALTAKRVANCKAKKGNAKGNAKVTMRALPREEKSSVSKDTHKSASRHAFVKPSLSELEAYCLERGNSVNPESFFDFYQSNGWKVGSNSMKDWKAAIRTWEKRDNHPKTSRPEEYVPPVKYLDLTPEEIANGRR